MSYNSFMVNATTQGNNVMKTWTFKIVVRGRQTIVHVEASTEEEAREEIMQSHDLPKNAKVTWMW